MTMDKQCIVLMPQIILSFFLESGEISLQIIKKVLIKRVITEKSRAQLRETFEKEIKKLERESQQLLFEQRKLQNKLSNSKREINQRFQREIKRRKDKIVLIEFKIEQLDILQIGSEIVEGEVDAIVNVEVGSDWKEIMSTQSIVIKDDKIIRIDNE